MIDLILCKQGSGFVKQGGFNKVFFCISKTDNLIKPRIKRNHQHTAVNFLF